MAASKPTNLFVFNFKALFSIKKQLQALTANLGCFPLEYKPYHLYSNMQRIKNTILSYSSFSHTNALYKKCNFTSGF